MSIPLAAPALVPQILNAVGARLSWVHALVSVNGLEAGFYAALNGGTHHTFRAVNWIREASVARFQNLQTLFHVINLGVVLLAGGQLLLEIQKRFSARPANGLVLGLFASIPVALGVIGVVSASVYLLNRFLSDVSQPSDKIGQVDVSEQRDSSQKVAQVLQIAKIVISVALLVFSKNKLWLVFSIATEGYSLFQNKALKWMTFSRSFPFVSRNPKVPVTQLKATYKVLGFPFDQIAASQDKCAICLDDTEDVNMSFCANHLFHKDCVADLVVAKSDSFVNNPAITKTETRHYINLTYTHSTYGYKIDVSQNNFPACPICRDIPLQNECEIEVTDRLHGKIGAVVTIQRRQRIAKVNLRLFTRSTMLHRRHLPICKHIQNWLGRYSPSKT